MDWTFSNDRQSIENNEPIINYVSIDFAKNFHLEVDKVKAAFDVDYIHTNRSTEDVLLLYTNKDDDEVFRYFTNLNMETYRTLAKSEVGR
ncbi:MAG: hypothetical protein V4594_23165 [Bacteroidota bacterium]